MTLKCWSPSRWMSMMFTMPGNSLCSRRIEESGHRCCIRCIIWSPQKRWSSQTPARPWWDPGILLWAQSPPWSSTIGGNTPGPRLTGCDGPLAHQARNPDTESKILSRLRLPCNCWHLPKVECWVVWPKCLRPKSHPMDVKPHASQAVWAIANLSYVASCLWELNGSSSWNSFTLLL